MVHEQRLQNEIEHGKFLLQHGAGEIWNWLTPAGKLRWQRRIKLLTTHITSGMNVLEIGCGLGYLTKELAHTNANIFTLDISLELLQAAKDEISSPQVHFLRTNAYQLPFQQKIFDSIVGSSVLHHLDIDNALNEFYRVLKAGGTVYFTEPNMLNPQIMLQKNIPYLKKKLGDSPDETAFFKWQLQRKFQECGFTSIKIIPFDFLHPQIPEYLIPFFQPLCQIVEHLPVISEIAGSLYIRAQR